MTRSLEDRTWSGDLPLATTRVQLESWDAEGQPVQAEAVFQPGTTVLTLRVAVGPDPDPEEGNIGDVSAAGLLALSSLLAQLYAEIQHSERAKQ